MGCLQSRRECPDVHPNVFKVINIDEDGADLWSGQIELTESKIILWRVGAQENVWPLVSLRKYGFDGEIFSFEAGRRCKTGEGIYAFRCRRADALFSQLQHNIQRRNLLNGTMHFQIPPNIINSSPTVVPRPALHAQVVHRSSFDSGQTRNPTRNGSTVSQTVQSPRSPSNVDILEITPLNPRPQNNTNQVTNVYQVKEYKSKERNNNNGEPSQPGHAYTNDTELSKSLARLRNDLRDHTNRANQIEILEENAFLKTVGNNRSPTSPTASVTSFQDQSRAYMNLRATEIAKKEFFKSFEVPATPLTPNQPDYCNFNLNYTNVNLNDLPKGLSKSKFFSEESDAGASLSPVADEVNYAILDIGVKEKERVASPASDSPDSSQQESSSSLCTVQTVVHLPAGSGRQLSLCSLEPPATLVPGCVGYTTIDFDLTTALTSVASAAVAENESACGTPEKGRY